MIEVRTDFERIRRYSVGHGADPSVSPGEIILLLPQPAQSELAQPSHIRLARIFENARELLQAGKRVRVVATGASLPDSWPEWIGEISGLITTELGAYRDIHPIIATRGLAGDAHAWLDFVAGHADPDGGVSEMLYASLSSRALQPLFDAVSYIQGLATAHPGAEFHCADADWVGLEYLRTLAAQTGGEVLPAASSAKRGWRGRVVTHLVFRLALAIAGQLRRYYLSAPSRKVLRRRRTEGSPRLWLALQPDWPRVNRHVLAELASAPADYGILISTTLVPGDVTRPGHAGPLWPGLPADVISEESPVALDQIAGPMNATMLAAGLCKGIMASLRAAWRLIKHESKILELAGGLGNRAIADGISRLLTVDLLQVVLVGDATRDVVARRRLRGATVVFANLNMTDTAVADSALRHAGAFTVDFRHGSGGAGWFGMHESFSNYALVWSAADIQLTDMLSRAAAVITPPAVPRFKCAEPLKRVLIVTGYSHDCWSLSGFPLRPFEIELLRGVEILSRQYPELEICWRPHPSDEPSEIAARLERFPFLRRSDSANISEDLAWADLVVSYGGTTLGQAIQAGLPVIAHVIPELLTYPDTTAIHPSRRFFYATDLPGCFARLNATIIKDPEAAAAADRRIFDALFTPSLTTKTIKNLDFASVC
jgi:hypothetical protein